MTTLPVTEWLKRTSGSYIPLKQSCLSIFKAKSGVFNTEPQDVPGTSGCNFWGAQSQSSIRDDDLFTNPEKLPTAVASILHRVQCAAGFDPRNMSPESLGFHFFVYLILLEYTPYFSIELISENIVELNFSDPNYMFDCLANNMSGVDPSFKKELKKTCYQMAKSTFGSRTADEGTNLFCQSVMDFHAPDNATFFLYYTNISMHHDSSGKNEVSTQRAVLYSYRLKINRQIILNDSSELLAIERKSTDDWLSSNTSPSASASLCFSYKPYIQPQA